MTTTSSRPVATSRTLNLVGAGLLVLTALIHVLVLVGEAGEYTEEHPIIGVLFVVGIVASLVGAGLLVRAREAVDLRWAWIVGGGTALVMLIAFLLSRTGGLFGFSDGEAGPLAIVSVVDELAIVVLAGMGLRPSS